MWKLITFRLINIRLVYLTYFMLVERFLSFKYMDLYLFYETSQKSVIEAPCFISENFFINLRILFFMDRVLRRFARVRINASLLVIGFHPIWWIQHLFTLKSAGQCLHHSLNLTQLVAAYFLVLYFFLVS